MPEPTTQVLVLSDDKRLTEFLTKALTECGCSSASLADEAGLKLESGCPDLIFTDLESRGTKALEFIAALPDWGFDGRVVVIAGQNSMSLVRTALGKGAVGYLRRPLEAWEVERVVKQLGTRAWRRWTGETIEDTTDKPMYGSSPEIQTVLKIADQVARRDDDLILLGEPGSGKRLIGRLIHYSSRRSPYRFMSLSCSGLSESVIERELFGYRDRNSGSPSGRHPGCLELCDSGTLLLDEVGDLPRRTQERVLRCMVRGAFPVAGGGSRQSDVRIIGTSSRDLAEKTLSGLFHRELFERLQGIKIRVPPLRDRRSDIPILIDQYVRSGARTDGKNLNGVSPSALARLMQYDWPGNVRELEDMIKHAVSRAQGMVLADEDLPSLPVPIGSQPGALGPGATIQEIEKEAILRTLKACGGSTSRAARSLGMSVRKVQYKLKQYREEPAAAIRLETVRKVEVAPPSPPKKVLHQKKAVLVAESDWSERG